ncbi:MAG: hypothetical protein AB7F59_11575 [Bdellovibrionales bacterium]
MKLRNWFVILGAEVVVIFMVIALFKSFDRQIAGLLAGSLFSFLGIFIGLKLVKTRVFLKTATFWWLFVYMFYSVIPMLLTRLKNWDSDFEQIQIWGMMGPEFHQISERIYLILIFATLFDLALATWNYRKSRRIH